MLEPSLREVDDVLGEVGLAESEFQSVLAARTAFVVGIEFGLCESRCE